MQQLLKKPSQLTEVVRFQIIFTTMLAGMAVGVFLFGRNQHITYVTTGSLVAIPSLISASLFMWMHYIAEREKTKTVIDRLLNLASRVLILFGLTAAFFLALGTLDTIIPQQPSSALGVSFVICMLLSYFLYVFSIASTQPTSQQLIHFIALGLISCVVMGIAVDGTDDWWTKHFSALGASTASSAFLFRIALSMTSFAFVVIGHRIAQTIQRQRSSPFVKVRSRLVLAFFYTAAVAGTIAALVGYDQNFTVHDIAAKILGATMGLFIVSSYWLFPSVPKSFIAYSVALAAASLISWPYVQSLTLKLSYYEIASAAGAIIWLSMFIHLIETPGRNES